MGLRFISIKLAELILLSMQAIMLSMSVIGQPTLRLKYSVIRHETMIGECTHVVADGIYPINENRIF